MKTNPRNVPALPCLTRAAALFLLCMPAALAAQTAAPAVPPDEEIVVMEQFNIVESANDNDWVSTQAMSGTRTSELIANLPYQMQVVTAEFMEDFDMVSVIDQLSSISGLALDGDSADPVAGATPSENATFRGFKISKLRDGFRNAPPPQLGNTRQVEVIKGPMSTLYGMAQPGGVINYISRRPRARPQYTAGFSAGNYDRVRGSVSINTPIYKKKLYLLGVASYSSGKGNIEYSQNETLTYFARLLYKPTRTTDITVSYELQKAEGRRGDTVPRWTTGNTVTGQNWSTTTGTLMGPYWDLATFNATGGPNEWYNRSYAGINFLLEQRLGKNWKFRVAYQWQEKKWDQNLYTDSNYCVDIPDGGMRAIYPRVWYQDYDYPYAVQADLLGHFKTGKIGHALHFLFDTAKIDLDRSYWELPSAQNRPVSGGGVIPDSVYYMDPLNPDWSTDWFSFGDIRSQDRQGGLSRLDSQRYEYERMTGYCVTERMYMFGNKLIFMGSLRYDEVYNKVYSGTRLMSDADWQGWRRALKDDDITYSAGCNWNPYGDNRLIVFGNYSTSYNTEIVVDGGTGEVMPNETGRGFEGGIRVGAFHGKMNMAVTGFQIEKHNIAQTNHEYYVAGDGTPEYTSTGTHRVRGADMDLDIRPFQGFVVSLAASYIDAKVIESSDPRYPVGSRKIKTPDKTLHIAAKYRFPGMFRGFTIGARMGYRSGYVNANYIARNSLVPGSNNAEQPYYEAPSLTVFGGFLKYEWRRKKTSQSLTLSGKNIMDKLYVGANRKVSLGRQVTLAYGISFR
ncbi:MAG: TonB-dependent receptor [Opitutaceae bacterium]|jgi:outer membrane receptor protein involved in Fe transport|nr:TonB-dependent receptor [Opitutaceae bacterium]